MPEEVLLWLKALKVPVRSLFYIILLTCCPANSQERLMIDFSDKSCNKAIDDRISNLSSLTDGTFVENNIKCPSVDYFKPSKPNGTAVLLIPGGGLYALFSDNEGLQLAEWLSSQGVSVFLFRHVLKQSLTSNPAQDLLKHFSLKSDYSKILGDPVYARAVLDARSAMQYIKECSAEMDVRPDRIGVMGFSTGAAIAAELFITGTSQMRPGFLISMDGFTARDKKVPPSASGPVFLGSILSSPLQENEQSIKLYQAFNGSDYNVELHIYKSGMEEQKSDIAWKSDVIRFLKALN
ncbi:alpha/beta hydrolase [Flavobacterium sp. HJSW_4]|uniref:alpha/beta hydrolase n=1 Tax=Flavobacterium sp. HJSW_4 TaxID=3344660 RepID=UPI0035F375CD